MLCGVLLIGQGYLLYRTESFFRAATPGPSAQKSQEAFSIGSAVQDVSGRVKAVEADAVTMEGPSGETRVLVSAETRVVEMGELKDQASQDRELAAYNAKIKELMQDPEKNRAELERLAIPPVFVEKSLRLSELASGDNVTIDYDINPSGAYLAIRILRTTKLPQGI